jgi:hypothetical protein
MFLDYAPFITVTKKNFEIISDDSILQKMAQTKYHSTFNRIIPPESNPNVQALQKMAHTFHNEDIEFILLVTPHQKYYLDSMPMKYTKSFDSIISTLSETSNLDVHSFFSKYQNMKIFSDLTHVSINNSIFNDEISNLIIKTLKN